MTTQIPTGSILSTLAFIASKTYPLCPSPIAAIKPGYVSRGKINSIVTRRLN